MASDTGRLRAEAGPGVALTGGGLFDGAVGIALAHQLAAVGAGKVHAVALGRRDEPTDLFEALGCQPALPTPALHGKAVGRFLVGSAELMSTLVGVDPQLYRCRDLG